MYAIGRDVLAYVGSSTRLSHLSGKFGIKARWIEHEATYKKALGGGPEHEAQLFDQIVGEQGGYRSLVRSPESAMS